jgi:hypothetical protein
MSGNVTFADLILEAKDRADMNNSNLVSLPMWKKYINKSKDALYDLLVKAYGNDYYTKDTPHSITTISGVDKYALPTDFYKTVKVELYIDQDNQIRLRKFSHSENRPYYYIYRQNNVRGYFYREIGNYLFLSPTPAASEIIRLWYIPLSTNLVNDADELQGFNGWEEFIIIDSAIKAKRKEESDTQELMIDKRDIIDRLTTMAESRNISEPCRIQDTERQNYDYLGEW